MSISLFIGFRSNSISSFRSYESIIIAVVKKEWKEELRKKGEMSTEVTSSRDDTFQTDSLGCILI